MRKTVLAIVGSRTFTDSHLLFRVLSNYFLDDEYGWLLDSITSGGAKGADTLAKEFAEDYGIPYVEYKADWDTYGKKAGFLRNMQIVDNCEVLLAFWDGKSKGTAHSIELARKAKKPTFIIYF